MTLDDRFPLFSDVDCFQDLIIFISLSLIKYLCISISIIIRTNTKNLFICIVYFYI